MTFVMVLLGDTLIYWSVKRIFYDLKNKIN